MLTYRVEIHSYVFDCDLPFDVLAVYLDGSDIFCLFVYKENGR